MSARGTAPFTSDLNFLCSAIVLLIPFCETHAISFPDCCMQGLFVLADVVVVVVVGILVLILFL